MNSFFLDQFPDRDGFRRLKSYNRFYILISLITMESLFRMVMRQKNKLSSDRKIGKCLCKRLNAINEQYFEGNNMKVYNTIIPDKAYFLADKAGCPKIDYENLVSR